MKFNGIELNPGCLVRLKNERGNCWNLDGEMDRYINRTVMISHIYDDSNTFEIIQDSDDSETVWRFGLYDIQEVVSIPLPEDQVVGRDPNNFSSAACQFVVRPEHTAKLKLGSNIELYITNKTFTEKQIKNWKKYFGVEVINLKSE